MNQFAWVYLKDAQQSQEARRTLVLQQKIEPEKIDDKKDTENVKEEKEETNKDKEDPNQKSRQVLSGLGKVAAQQL